MSTSLKTASGLDLDDLFTVVGNGTQKLSILTDNGIDIGMRYSRGSTQTIPDTMLRTADGVDVRHKLGGVGVGIYRPSCIAWNGSIKGLRESDDNHLDKWKSFLTTWKYKHEGASCMSGITDDAVYRGTNSDYSYTSIIFGYTPIRSGYFDFKWQEISTYGWGSNHRMYYIPFEIDDFCKGVMLRPIATAGGGHKSLIRVTLVAEGYGTFTYESIHGIDNDSNREGVGTSSWNTDFNGKQYFFH